MQDKMAHLTPCKPEVTWLSQIRMNSSHTDLRNQVTHTASYRYLVQFIEPDTIVVLCHSVRKCSISPFATLILEFF